MSASSSPASATATVMASSVSWRPDRRRSSPDRRLAEPGDHHLPLRPFVPAHGRRRRGRNRGPGRRPARRRTRGDALTDPEIVDVDAAHPPEQAEPRGGGELDQDEGERDVHARLPGVPVHREAVDHARAGDRDVVQVAPSAPRAVPPRREEVAAAPGAVLDDELTPGRALPELPVLGGDGRCDPDPPPLRPSRHGAPSCSPQMVK